MMLDKRYIARVVLEALTPLRIGTGKHDQLIALPLFMDVNDYPRIPGTALAGFFRHALQDLVLDEAIIDDLFGWTTQPQTLRRDGDQEMGEGSRLIFSPGYFVLGKNKISEEILGEEEIVFTSLLRGFPVREHCRISHKGAAAGEEKGKFNELLVPKGCRFKLELELLSSTAKDEDRERWLRLLGIMKSPHFRLGGGTRMGCGCMAVNAIKSREYDLRNPADLDAWLSRSASLQEDPEDMVPEDQIPVGITTPRVSGWESYRLKLKPVDTFLFSSGIEDEGPDRVGVFEPVITWDEEGDPVVDTMMVIPATSIKGAISHRVAFHYNCLTKCRADEQPAGEGTGRGKEAVKALFGSPADDEGAAGNVFITDLYLPAGSDTKVFNHVGIDRFTGGARQGVLFSEQTVACLEESMDLEILVNTGALGNSESSSHIRKAFIRTLEDIASGMLPLGGSVMRGHGRFRGELIEQEEAEGRCRRRMRCVKA